MKRFHADIRPLVMEGLSEMDIPQSDLKLYRAVQKGLFPAWYMLSRIQKKLTMNKGERL